MRLFFYIIILSDLFEKFVFFIFVLGIVGLEVLLLEDKMSFVVFYVLVFICLFWVLRVKRLVRK